MPWYGWVIGYLVLLAALTWLWHRFIETQSNVHKDS